MLRALDVIFQIAGPELDSPPNLQDIYGKVECGQLPEVKSTFKAFLSALYHLSSSEVLLTSNGDFLQVFYGTLLLFLIRTSLRAILHYPIDGHYAYGEQSTQDVLIGMGSASLLYQPLLSVLETTKMTFGGYLQRLDTDPALKKSAHLRQHYEIAASLMSVPDPLETSIAEHVFFFFEQFYVSHGGHCYGRQS